MDSTQRATELFAAVESFNRVHDQWCSDDNTRYPTLAYWQAFDQMLATFERGDMPANCRTLATAVFRLAQEKAVFDLSDSEEPKNSFWAAREGLEKAAKSLRSPLEKRHLESIAELDRQKVPHEQIARIWGLRRTDGSGMAHLVQQELNQPGSVIGPDYVHPDDRQQHDEMMRERLKYQSMSAKVQAQEAERVEEEEKPCPETPRELWLIGVSTQQAAKMLKRDQSEVARMWEEFEQEKRDLQMAKSPQQPQPAVVSQPVVSQPVESVETRDPPINGESEEETQSDTEDADETDDEGDFDWSDWSDEEIKAEAKRLGISLRGRFSRESAIQKIEEAESVSNEAGEPIEAETE